MIDWKEATLRGLNNFAAQGILVTDAELTIRGWNHWLETHSGRSAADVMGHNLLEVYPELVERGLEQYYRDALAGRVCVLSYRFHRYLLPLPSDYRPGPMAQSAQIAPLVEEGRVIGTITVIEDVTERVERENALRESEQWLRTTLRSIGDAVIATDEEGLVTFMNPVAEDLTGWSEGEAVGQPLENVFHIINEQTGEQAPNPVTKVIREGTVVGLANHTVLVARDGMKRPIADSGAPIRDRRGNIVGTVMVFRDVTKQRRAERAVEERRRYLEGVLGAVPDAIVTLDAHHRIVEWNPGAEKLFGYSREEVIGQNIDDLITGPDVFDEAASLTQMVLSGREVPPTETVRYQKDGSPVDVIVAGSPIVVGDEFVGIVAVYTDITERVRMEETLRALALVDELTGLYNRRGFLTLGQQQLKGANRAKRSMVLLFTDFNGLKQINDTLGHSEGDQALIEIAEVLKETFRESDIVARIGGDEFVVLAIETNRVGREILATRLQENLKARNARRGRRYKLSLSVGMARYDPESPCSIDELLTQADRAMYEQKRSEASQRI